MFETITDMPSWAWFVIGIVLIVFALIPGIIFAVFGVLSIIYWLFLVLKQKNARGRVF